MTSIAVSCLWPRAKHVRGPRGAETLKAQASLGECKSVNGSLAILDEYVKGVRSFLLFDAIYFFPGKIALFSTYV